LFNDKLFPIGNIRLLLLKNINIGALFLLGFLYALGASLELGEKPLGNRL